MKLYLRLAAVCATLASCGNTPSTTPLASDASNPIYIRVPNAMLSPSWIEQHQFNRDHGKDDIFALGWMKAAQLEALPHEDKASITVLDEEAVRTGRLQPFTLKEISSFDAEERKAGGKFEDYHNYAALTAELKSLANNYSEISQLESAGKSIQGRELWMMRISGNIAGETQKPKLLYIANMHGDEVVGRELTLYHIRRLLKEYGQDDRITNLLDNAEIFIIPSMNPDGFEKRQRYNAGGVDLNRNFPDFTSDHHNSPAGRAVETAAIMALHNKHHFVAALNFHGGEVCFNLPWDTTPNSGSGRFGDDAVLSQMARSYADSNKTMAANNNFDRGVTYGYEWYEVNGGMQDWSIYYKHSMHATIELSYTKWPSASHLPVAWNENKEAMLAYLERSLTGVHIEAVDASGQPVSGFKVSVNTSKRSVEFPLSVGSRTTLEGTQEVTVEAPGYKPTSLTLNARSFDGRYDRVVLVK